jgi:hypothetical protein
MKSFTTFERLLIIISICLILGGITTELYRIDRHNALVKRVDGLNAKIKHLQNEGYSVEASKKIALVELGFIPVDAEYKALKED